LRAQCALPVVHLLGAFAARVCQKQFAKKTFKMEILTVQDIGPFFTHLTIFLDLEELVIT
jgi:hypothetical protein